VEDSDQTILGVRRLYSSSDPAWGVSGPVVRTDQKAPRTGSRHGNSRLNLSCPAHSGGIARRRQGISGRDIAMGTGRRAGGFAKKGFAKVGSSHQLGLVNLRLLRGTTAHLLPLQQQHNRSGRSRRKGIEGSSTATKTAAPGWESGGPIDRQG